MMLNFRPRSYGIMHIKKGTNFLHLIIYKVSLPNLNSLNTVLRYVLYPTPIALWSDEMSVLNDFPPQELRVVYMLAGRELNSAEITTAMVASRMPSL